MQPRNSGRIALKLRELITSAAAIDGYLEANEMASKGGMCLKIP